MAAECPSPPLLSFLFFLAVYLSVFSGGGCYVCVTCVRSLCVLGECSLCLCFVYVCVVCILVSVT